MGTKLNPGEFDCYKNAHPDEPMFVLLGRDPVAPLVVQFWAFLRSRPGGRLSGDKLAEALSCADAMSEFRSTYLERKSMSPKELKRLFKKLEREKNNDIPF